MLRPVGTTSTALLLLALASGCAGEDPVAVDTGPVASQATPGDASSPGHAEAHAGRRPLSQRSWGTLSPLGPCPGGVAFAASGEGIASHIGRFQIQLDWCLDPGTGTVLGGTAVATAANGDEAAMTLAGSAPSLTRLSMEATIVGGTGRFDDATGRLDSEIALDGSGGWSGEGTGWISY